MNPARRLWWNLFIINVWLGPTYTSIKIYLAITGLPRNISQYLAITGLPSIHTKCTQSNYFHKVTFGVVVQDWKGTDKISIQIVTFIAFSLLTKAQLFLETRDSDWWHVSTVLLTWHVFLERF